MVCSEFWLHGGVNCNSEIPSSQCTHTHKYCTNYTQCRVDVCYVKQFNPMLRIIVRVQTVGHFQDLFLRERRKKKKPHGRIFQIPNSWSWQVASCKLYGELLIVVWQRNKSGGFILSWVQSGAECSSRTVPHVWSTSSCKADFWACGLCF